MPCHPDQWLQSFQSIPAFNIFSQSKRVIRLNQKKTLITKHLPQALVPESTRGEGPSIEYWELGIKARPRMNAMKLRPWGECHVIEALLLVLGIEDWRYMSGGYYL